MRFHLALILATAAYAQDTPPPIVNPNSACSIDGTVIDQMTHAPVPRAKIVLRGSNVIKLATADNSGDWSITSLPCVTVEIDASRFGYLGNGRTTDRPAEFLLTADSPAHATIELMPQAVVTGTAVDGNGDPVSARIVSRRARVIDGSRVFSAGQTTATDDLGHFRLAQLAPGNYIFCAEPLTADYRQTCYPGPIESGASSAMNLSPAQEGEIDFVLPNSNPVTISGTVSGIPENTRASVQLLRTDSAGTLPGAAIGVAPDGKFTILSVSPGSYTLIARAQDNQARMPLEVGSSDVAGLTVALEPPLKIEGNLGIDSDDVPPDVLSRFNISLISSDPSPGVVTISFADDDRSFTILGISPGTYRLRFRSDAYFLESATLNGADISRGEFNIDSTSGPMYIVISDRGGELDGDVVLDDGSPATAASVILLRNGEFARIVNVTNGHFNTRNLQPGDYTATAWDSTRNVEYANPDWMRQYAGVSITITADQTANVKLTRLTAPPEY